MTIQRNIVSNTVLSILGQLIPAVAAILVLPALAHALGIDRLGFLSLVWTVIGYFSILDFGLGLGVTKSVAAVIGTPEAPRIRPIFWTAWLSQGLMGCVGGVVLWIFTGIVAHGILHVPESMAIEAHRALLMSAFTMPLIIMTPSLTGLLQAARRFDLLVLIQMPFAIGQYVLPYICARNGMKIDGIIGVLLLSRLVSFLLLCFTCSRVFKRQIGLPSFCFDELRSLIGFGSWVTIGTLVAPVVLYFDRFIITRFLTLSDVAFYAVPADALIRLLIIPSSIVSVAFPSFSQLKANSDEDSVRGLARHAIRAVFFIMVVPLGIVILCAPDLMTLWMGPSFSLKAAPVLRILALGALANAVARIPFGLLQAVGRPDLPSKLQLIELPLQIALACALTLNFGLSGTAFAWTLRLIAEMLVLLYLAQKSQVLCITSAGLIRVSTTAMFILLPAALLPVFMSPSLGVRPRLIVDLLWILGSALVIYRLGFTSSDRKIASRVLLRTP